MDRLEADGDCDLDTDPDVPGNLSGSPGPSGLEGTGIDPFVFEEGPPILG